MIVSHSHPTDLLSDSSSFSYSVNTIQPKPKSISTSTPPPNVKHHLANSDESILAVKSRVTNSLLEQEGGEVGVTKAILVLISFAASTRIVGR
mmetsp:Transcript_3876/g.8588  ORF Transcript_3876/g.8588 Transcript_3876/m.8588 type:complete len:93 (+) Transcript_3876:84-362(+)